MLSSTVMSVSPGVPTPTPAPSLTPPTPPSSSPVRAIPGSYGWRVLGQFADRLDYFWFQGPEKFFRKRIEKYKSTVFRTNVPPTFPFFAGVNPNVIAVLDCKSFSFLFDMDVVEKKNGLVGEFMPSFKYTDGIRVCAYLDTAEIQHARAKGFAMDILRRSSSIWASEFAASVNAMWDTIDAGVAKSNSASYIKPLQRCIFKFLTKCLVGVDPSVSPQIAESGYAMLDKWLFLQLLPDLRKKYRLRSLGLNTGGEYAYPFFVVEGDYRKIYDFIEQHGQTVIQRGQTEFNLSKEETIHNLLFVLGFNAFGGFSIFFLSLVSTLGSKPELQAQLREEVRSKIKPGSNLTFESVKDLELVHSVVYETLRLNPPAPLQYARARKDFLLSSHDSVFEIKKGDLLCGFQKLAMRDPKIFDDPETFVADRFTKEGRELLNYLYWSNGPQTGSPSEMNKQCAAKDYVTMTAILFVAHMFLRYDSVTASSSSVTALEKAT